MNFLNGIIHLPFLEFSIIILGISRLEHERWSANSIEPVVQTDLVLYWWQNVITFGSSRIRVNLHETVGRIHFVPPSQHIGGITCHVSQTVSIVQLNVKVTFEVQGHLSSYGSYSEIILVLLWKNVF